MKWPWVSRDAFDAVNEQRQREAFDRANVDARWRQMYDVLLAKYHDLMQRRANSEQMAPAVAPKAPEVDLVMLEVANQAGRDHRLYAILAAFVQMQRAKRGTDPNALDESALLHKVGHWDAAPNDGVPEGSAPEGFWPDPEDIVTPS